MTWVAVRPFRRRRLSDQASACAGRTRQRAAEELWARRVKCPDALLVALIDLHSDTATKMRGLKQGKELHEHRANGGRALVDYA